MRWFGKTFRKRCYRWLAIFFAVIAMADAGLWVRGQYACDGIRFTITDDHNISAKTELYDVTNYRNTVAYSYFVHPHQRGWHAGWSLWKWPADKLEGDARVVGRLLGVTVRRVGDLRDTNRDPRLSVDYTVAVAHRTIVIISLAMCVLFFRLSRTKRFLAGACQHCGYDLRATPERCPECGTVPEKQVTA